MTSSTNNTTPLQSPSPGGPKTSWVALRDGVAVYSETWLPVSSPSSPSVPQEISKSPVNTQVKANAAIVFVHGMGDHIGRYTQFFRALADAGFAVVAWDQRGWGRSVLDSDTGVGKRWLSRGHSGSRSVIMGDIAETIERAREFSPNVFLMGQSMGGLFVLDYLTHIAECARENSTCTSSSTASSMATTAGAISSEANTTSTGTVTKAKLPNLPPTPMGVISMSPALGVPPQTAPGFFKFHSAKLASMLFPRLTIDTNLRMDALSHDPAVGEYAATDALCVPVVSLTLAKYILERGPELANGKADVSCKSSKNSTSTSNDNDNKTGCNARAGGAPTLLLHGTDDVITDHEASKRYVAARCAATAGSEDVTIRLYEGYLHELLKEPDIKDEVTANIVSWINSHNSA